MLAHVPVGTSSSPPPSSIRERCVRGAFTTEHPTWTPCGPENRDRMDRRTVADPPKTPERESLDELLVGRDEHET